MITFFLFLNSCDGNYPVPFPGYYLYEDDKTGQNVFIMLSET